MVYLVHLKGKDDPVKIEADRVISDDPHAMLFYKTGIDQPIAVIPPANVSYVVKGG